MVLWHNAGEAMHVTGDKKYTCLQTCNWIKMTRMTGTTASIRCNLCSEIMFTCVDHTNNCNNRLCNVNTAFIIHWPMAIHPL